MAERINRRVRAFEPILAAVLPIIAAMQNATHNTSDASDLSNKADRFAHSVQWWNKAYLILLGLTFIASAIVVLRSNALSRAQKDLSLDKDRQLSLQLKDKDEKIADLGKAAEELKQSNIEAQRALEEEKLKRLDLETMLAPRELPLRSSPDNTIEGDALKEFAGMHVFIWVLPDAEARRAAASIAGVVQSFGLLVDQVRPEPELNASWSDGVVIKTPCPFTTGSGDTVKDRKSMQMCEGAADELLALLRLKGWQAEIRSADMDEKVPLNAIKVEVGFKPASYFKADWEKKRDEKFRKRDEGWRQQRKAAREQGKLFP